MHIDIPSLLARADEVIELVRPLCTHATVDAQVSSRHTAADFRTARISVSFRRYLISALCANPVPAKNPAR